MAFDPQAYRPETTILSLGETFYDVVEAASFPERIIRFRNDRAAVQIGLGGTDDAAWAEHFGRFRPLPGSLRQPLAQRYHGHQFRAYNPEIGDGRGFTLAQLRDHAGRLMDLGTKGSGQTPWSRFGDGRLTLKGGVREVLATEMLEALNVRTSRSLSLIETGEALQREDEPSPTRAAVLVRLSHSHIRVGTFQRLAYEQDVAAMRRLVGYVLANLYQRDSDDPVVLLELVIAETARLAASYMAAGFVHGVLNTDNINIMGESFDYGPWRFTPTWEPAFTAAYFDHNGLYAFGRQPEAIHWSVMQLAASLRLLTEADPLIAALEGFAPAYQAAITDALLWRLGRSPTSPDADRALVQATERALRESSMSIDRFFFDAFARPLPPGYGPEWDEARALLDTAPVRSGRSHAYWAGTACSLLIEEVEAIWSAIRDRDDWSPFHTKIGAIRAMGEALR